MTRADVVRWLDGRRPVPPEELRTHLKASVTELSAAAPLALPEYLAAVGRQLLEQVAGQPSGGRELALVLLAADALVTYAFEAQAEADPAGLAALATRVAETAS